MNARSLDGPYSDQDRTIGGDPPYIGKPGMLENERTIEVSQERA